MGNLEVFEKQFLEFILIEMVTDAAHDINHVLRVVKTAKQLSKQEGGNADIVIPAAYLHDCFTFPKGHYQRNQSSFFAAEKAIEFLNEIGYPKQYWQDIHHAIVAHSFSANVKPMTIEAKIVQDADRLDALGAVGIVRCLQVSTALGRTLYSTVDPFCANREPDDGTYTIDHFYTKLLKLADTMQTHSAKAEAAKRTSFMQSYLDQLANEV
ncbi:HD domain-containing protein [Photobacterium sp. S4TG1]|uniref:HD domain-containing protein n=1 Tax=Photobacterium sp. S4TG1 TaxID=3114587 RepID=UPI002E19C85D|nr:HD domain-containing protein [Photobacterium sp. S4TG1]